MNEIMVKCRSLLILFFIKAFAISDGVKSRRKISRCQYTHLEPKQIAVRCEKLFRTDFSVFANLSRNKPCCTSEDILVLY